MIELHQYPAIWGLPSLSPFCFKVEVFLRRHRLPYRVIVERNPAAGPKGKMPFIRDGQALVADSKLILNHLTVAYGLSAPPDPNEAQSLAFQRLIEEHLYFALLYSRWLDPLGWDVCRRDFAPLFPPLIGRPVLELLRRRLRHQARAQGLGRHSAPEIYAFARQDVRALSAFLSDKTYFLGERWTSVDATLYAFLATILKQPIESELKAAVTQENNLMAYCARQDLDFSKVRIRSDSKTAEF